jgi:photosystem II stability/assembly factor-like uncharacterized protein
MQKKCFILLAAGICALMAVESRAAAGWVQQTSHTTARLGSPYFLDENTGFVAGDSGVVLKTKDGGTTWTRLDAGNGAGIMDVQAIDTNLVYVATWDSGKVVKTSDGGGTWSNAFAGKTPADAAMGICFTSSQKGFVCIGKSSPFPYSNSRILRTINGGTSWDTVYTTSQWISYIQFPDAAHGYATGSHGTVFKSIDSGATWTASTVDDSLWMSGVFFLNKDTGYVSGAGGFLINNTYGLTRVFKTTNGGSSWSTVTTKTFGIKLFFVNDSTGYLVGGDSMIITVSPAQNIRMMKTQDGGLTWQRIDPGTSRNLSGVCFPSPNVGYVAGDSGKIFKFQETVAISGKNRAQLKHAAAGIDFVALNSFNGKLQIRYSLSSGDYNQVTFSMFTIKGECIWKNKINGGLIAGSNTAVFSGGSPIAAGTYIFSISATNASTGHQAITSKAVLLLP